jgi:hypothetical protein
MHLTPSRPVTIERVRYGCRWFPYLFRHTDDSLLLYVQYGHDANFSPALRLRSTDNGHTWGDACDNVPRQCWSHSFDDGELFEIDTYGVQDPKSPEHAVYWGAWSQPGRVNHIPRREFVRVHAPSIVGTPVSKMVGGYPLHQWWPVWNTLWGREDMSADQIIVNGPIFTSGVELENGRLLAVGYNYHRDAPAGKSCVVALESTDRGHTWREIAIAMRDDSTPEGPDEASLIRLKDGRLYLVARTGAALHHAYSSDGGRAWTRPEPIRLIDDGSRIPGLVWPVVTRLDAFGGALVMVYGRPGKNLIYDPTGTGTAWRYGLDLTKWELESQAFLEVPPDQRIHRPHPMVRDWDSSDYLGVVPDGTRGVIVVYDVQQYIEHAGAKPVSAVRLVRVAISL